MKKSQSGFSHLGLVILLLIVIGGVGYVGYKVGTRKNNGSNASSTNTSNAAQTTAAQNTYKIPDGFVQYENKELGFSFAYPKEWGDVSEKRLVAEECADTIKSSNGEIVVTGERYDFSFSKNTGSNVYAQTNDYKVAKGVMYCGFVPQQYAAVLSTDSFGANGNFDYVVTDDNVECGRDNYFLFGRAKLMLKNVDTITAQLHAVKDTGKQQCEQDPALVEQTKKTLTDQDKQFLTSFKKL